MSDLLIPRRRFLAGLASLVAAPAIVRASSLMPVRPFLFPITEIYDGSPIPMLMTTLIDPEVYRILFEPVGPGQSLEIVYKPVNFVLET